MTFAIFIRVWNDIMRRTVQAECGSEVPEKILLESSIDLGIEGE